MTSTEALRTLVERNARRLGQHPLVVLALLAEIAERHLPDDAEDTHAAAQYTQLRRWVDAEIDACLSATAYAEFN